MHVRHNFNIVFFLKSGKVNKGTSPLYAKVTINGEFSLLSLRLRLPIKFWNKEKQQVEGNSSDSFRWNEEIRIKRNQLHEAYDSLRLEKKLLTAETVKIRAEGGERLAHSLISLIDYHNTDYGRPLEQGTLKNYRTTKRFVKEFLETKMGKSDMPIDLIDYKFITDFALYLRYKDTDRGQRPCTNNTVMKHMERIKKILNIAVKNNWIAFNPLDKFERKIVLKDRECLDREELCALKNVNLTIPGHRIIRDKMIFSCYTGLAYADIERLSGDCIHQAEEGVFWLEMTRKKTLHTTEKKFHVLLLPEALSLIEKYSDHPRALENGTVFPPYSNQATNRYLKEIARIANIKKDLTYHIARHTFATTVTLDNGVPMESVSHMLGHSSIRTTQIYSKVKKKKVENDMMLLREKLGSLH